MSDPCWYAPLPGPLYPVIDCRCEPCRIADGDPDCARRDCVREMEATRPLPECVTGSGGRCVTCEQLHGVSVTHRGRA